MGVSGITIKFVINESEVTAAAAEAWEIEHAGEATHIWAAREAKLQAILSGDESKARDARGTWDDGALNAWRAKNPRGISTACIDGLGMYAFNGQHERDRCRLGGRRDRVGKMATASRGVRGGRRPVVARRQDILCGRDSINSSQPSAPPAHCADGPAFMWFDDIREHYWHGTHVPAEWIMDRAKLTAEVALSQQNIERRRTACDILGWHAILSELGAVTIDHDSDPQIGELVEVHLPGELLDTIRARYLRVQCGTGRMFAVCVPPDTQTARDAQAWMIGVRSEEFIRPEIRT